MSSSTSPTMPPESSPNPPPTKRKRLQGACDNCRRKKARCDSSVMPDKKCSNCTALGSECTHLYANQKHAQILNRTPLKTAVEGASSGSLGDYREKMNGLLTAVLSSTYQAPSHPAILRDTLVSLARYSRALEQVLPSESWATTPVPTKYEPPPPISGKAPSSEPEDDSGSENEDEPDSISVHLREVLFLKSDQGRFFGPSSTSNFLATALEFSKDYILNPQATEITIEKHKRAHFWNVPTWESIPAQPRIILVFPDPDLLDYLVDIYFTKVNIFLPFLHRPTFEQSIKARLHLSNPDFGASLLAVCALASRYTDDRRVVEDRSSSELSCGYHWFRQIEASLSFSRLPSLYTVQAYLLAALFVNSTSTAEKSWYLLGLAIRAAQDIGLNRPNRAEGKSTQGELRNRLWWALVVGEVFVSVTVGRPCSIHPSDHNVDLPTDCDDEYWENPDPLLSFKQPQGKPSTVAHFIKLIALFNILGNVQRTLYAVRPKEHESEQERGQILTGIETAMNSWEHSVPLHLRPHKHHKDRIFLHQSASLWITFHYVQMLVHRPYISRRNMRSASLETCTRAARLCSRVMESQPAGGYYLMPAVQMYALSMASLFLLIEVWRKERSHVNVEQSDELRDIHRCINLMQAQERRNAAYGRRVDLILALLAASKLPLPNHHVNPLEPFVFQIDPQLGGPAPPVVPRYQPAMIGRSPPSYDDHAPTPQKDGWLDMLIDDSPRGSASAGPSAGYPRPHRALPRRAGGGGSASAGGSSHVASSRGAGSEDRRYHAERWRPHAEHSAHAAGPSSLGPAHASGFRPSSLRFVSMYDPPREVDMDDDEDVDDHGPGMSRTASISTSASNSSTMRSGMLQPVGAGNGMAGGGMPPGVVNGVSAEREREGPGVNGVNGKDPYGARKSDGHWRNPYVYDANPDS
ncbi:hypothetical protein FA15DRAFT_643581 [Coprinopsis marcescibilis]|uniref:Zn(2)-C6 fungal-type domain-containing protein n=1 Tax=Coprinopsis marcescibilis TaxID=230819 RepID=A0A5C3L3P4_COPMA|nr:hypothetical protein FA15DRAFT_643581 [Coprinopsis marcescibilis]